MNLGDFGELTYSVLGKTLDLYEASHLNCTAQDWLTCSPTTPNA